MDWIKIKDKHLVGWSLIEVGAIVKIQLLAARLERKPTEKEMLAEVPQATYRQVARRLQGLRTSLAEVLHKVCRDVAAVEERRCRGLARLKKWREKGKKGGGVTRNGDVLREDKIREDKIREDKKGKGNRFAPPTLAVIKELWEGGGLKGDPEEFFNHFESNGWRVGGRGAMKNWMAAARNWSKRESKFNKEDEKWTPNRLAEHLTNLPGTRE